MKDNNLTESIESPLWIDILLSLREEEKQSDSKDSDKSE